MASASFCGVTLFTERTALATKGQERRGFHHSQLVASLSSKSCQHDCKHRKPRAYASHAARLCVSPLNPARLTTCRQSISRAGAVTHEAAEVDSISHTATRRDTSSHTGRAASPILAGVLTGSAAAAAILMAGAGPAAAAAEDLVTYDNAAGAGNIQNVFGVGYAMLVAVFAWRLLSRRIKRAKSERLSKAENPDAEAPQLQRWSDALIPADATPEQEEGATPLSALYGAAQAAVFFALLWTFTGQISDYFDAKLVPVNPLAAKVTNSVKTIAEGLAYLLTFIFGANAVGLLALSAQLVFFPGSVTTPQAKKVDPKALPKINVTDDLYSIRKAFEEVQKSDKPGR